MRERDRAGAGKVRGVHAVTNTLDYDERVGNVAEHRKHCESSDNY
jgi:hypothetical protein